MERLFLFCFRSCLRGDGEREYYDVLELDRHSRVTPEIAKKQYKKLSLALHPDKLAQRGVEITPEHKQRFLKLKEAYDVLSDPRRKRLYDEYGESGLKLLESPTEVNHMDLLKNFQNNRGDRTTLALCILTFFLCLFLLPVLFSLKSDGTLGSSAPWVAIWSPMWFVDLILLASSTMALFSSEKPELNAEEDEESPPEQPSLLSKLYSWARTVSLVLLQILVTMRMDHYTHWSWYIVFIPWYVYEGLVMMGLFQLCFLTEVYPPSHESVPLDAEEMQEDAFMHRMKMETDYFEKVMEISRGQNSFIVSILRVWQALFLAARLDHLVDWNWGLVFLPIWMYLATEYIFAYLYRSWGNNKLKGLDAEGIMSGLESDPVVLVRFQHGQELTAYGSLICFTQLVPLFIAIMLVCRLQSAHYSTFLIILPVFIILSCSCCIVFCGIFCLSNIDMNSLEEEILKAQRGETDGGADVEIGAAGAAGAEGAYEPPRPSNENAPPATDHQAVVIAPADESYGTFADSSSSAAASQSQAEESKEKEAVAPSALLPTTIDVDID